MSDQSLAKYQDLIGAFVRHELPVGDFEQQYLAMFKDDSVLWPESVFAILNDLFGAVDSFCADPDLRGQILPAGGLDEDQLREEAARAHQAIARILQ